MQMTATTIRRLIDLGVVDGNAGEFELYEADVHTMRDTVVWDSCFAYVRRTKENPSDEIRWRVIDAMTPEEKIELRDRVRARCKATPWKGERK